MPRTKNLQHYPDRYREILRECGIEGKRVMVPVSDRKHGASMAGHFYAFLGSLKAEVARSKNPELSHLEKLAPTVMVQVVEDELGEVFVRFQHREHSWQAQALRDAIVSQPPALPTATRTLDETASRLMRIQQEKDDDAAPKS